MKKSFHRGSKRGAMLGGVLVVVAIRAAIAGVVAMAIPDHKRAPMRLSALDAANIRDVGGM